MIMSPEMVEKISIWRRRAIEGTLTPEEMREAILVLRQNRKTSSTAAARSRAKSAIVSADDLLGELGI